MFRQISEEEIGEILDKSGLLKYPSVREANLWAKAVHGGRKRHSGNPELDEHIFPVEALVIEHEKSLRRGVIPELVAAAALHDVVDDSSGPFRRDIADITRSFGQSVSIIIHPLVDKGYIDISRQDIAQRKIEGLKGERRTESSIIFLADKYANFCCMSNAPYLRGGEPNAIFLIKLMETESLVIPYAKKVSPFFYELLKNKALEYRQRYNIASRTP